METLGRNGCERSTAGLESQGSLSPVSTWKAAPSFQTRRILVRRHPYSAQFLGYRVGLATARRSLGEDCFFPVDLSMFSRSQGRGRLALSHNRLALPQHLFPQAVHENGDAQASPASGTQGGLVLFVRSPKPFLRPRNFSGRLSLFHYKHLWPMLPACRPTTHGLVPVPTLFPSAHVPSSSNGSFVRPSVRSFVRLKPLVAVTVPIP